MDLKTFDPIIKFGTVSLSYLTHIYLKEGHCAQMSLKTIVGARILCVDKKFIRFRDVENETYYIVPLSSIQEIKYWKKPRG